MTGDAKNDAMVGDDGTGINLAKADERDSKFGCKT
jgi:hypothetical protein